MRKFFEAILNRVVIVVLMMVVQLAVLIAILMRFNNYFVYFYAFNIVLSLAIAFHIINSWSNPTYKMAWLIPILLVPIFGGLMYLLFGGERVRDRARTNTQRLALRAREAFAGTGLPGSEELRPLSPDAAKQTHYITHATGTPLYTNTHTEYLPLGEVMFKRLKEELLLAKKYIFIEYFIIQPGVMWNAILEILVQKVNEGLDVRVIYDDMGCSFTLPNKYYKTLEALGIKCGVFNPFVPVLSSQFNNRSHRKTVVIDGVVSMTGGINLADEYINAYEKFGHWKDTAILLKGEASWAFAVQFLTVWENVRKEDVDFSAFLPAEPPAPSSNWIPGYVQPYSDSPLDNELVGETVYMNMITSAKNYLYITTPYLIIDNEMLMALNTAAKCGVDVRIITPAKRDKWYVHPVTQSYYEPLLANGVKIYEYTPGFIHAKSFVSDDEFAVVGTVNLDYRSLHLHFENGVWMYKAKAVAEVRDDFLTTLELCEEMTLEAVRKTPWPKRLFRSMLRVFAPLM